MCGISVFIGKNRTWLNIPEEINKMNDAIIHRGPDSGGFHIYKNVGLGHRRLSIIDLSNNAHQPMLKGNLIVSFNGEIYNYVELRTELEYLGHKFVSQSDTEVILCAFKEWGMNCFARFNGMWAIALLDELNEKIILCRDNFGIKPIFYGYNADGFFAGSEIKQFIHLLPQSELNIPQLLEYLNSGLLNYNENTFFTNVFELRPGNLIEININNLEFSKKQWYKKPQSPIIEEYSNCRDIVSNLLKESVHIRLRSDVSVGSCLSGGIDSSCLVSIIANEDNFDREKFLTFTSYYDEKVANELEYSDEVIKSFDVQNCKVKPDLDRVIEDGILDKIIFHHEQPISSMSNYSQHEVYKLTRKKNIKVLIDGQGADEYFLGYGIFRFEFLWNKLKKFKLVELSRFIRLYSTINGMSFIKSMKYLLGNPLLFIPILNFFRKRKIKLFSNNFSPVLTPRYIYNDLETLVIDQMFRSNLPSLLHSADRNSMMFSIETRLPFLDYRLFEYVSNMPQDFLFRTGYSKSILRDSVDSLPKKIKLRKDKMGFEAPTKQFVMNNNKYFRSQIEEVINKFSFLNPDLLDHFESFVRGETEYNELYFRLFAVNRFLKVFNLKYTL